MIPRAPAEAISTDLQKADEMRYNGHEFWAVFTSIGTSMRCFFSCETKKDMKLSFWRLRDISRAQSRITVKVLWSDNGTALVFQPVRDQATDPQLLATEPDCLHVKTSAPATHWETGTGRRLQGSPRRKAELWC